MEPMAAPSKNRPSQPGQVRAWLQLMRIANLPTAVSNVAAGAALVSPGINYPVSWYDITLFAVAVCISALLYTSGMILNDACDAEADAIERPNRPIPSGVIRRETAFKVGFGLMLFAIAVPAILSVYQLIAEAKNVAPLVSLLTLGIALSACIVLYDGPLKRTWLGAPTMGCCRTLNILLGTVSSIYFFGWYSPALSQARFAYPLSIGLFVTGITLLARSETKHQQSRIWLAIGSLMMLIALGMLATLNTVKTDWLKPETHLVTRQAYWAMLAIIAFPIVRRLILAVQKADPPTVGAAIGTSLSSLIFLDATVCFLVRPDKPIYAGAVASLIIPVMILRRFSAQT